MKVPDKIKKTIKACAEENNKARIDERIIIRWLERKKLTEDTANSPIRDMEDSFIDYCQMTYNPDKFIEELENLEEDKQ